MPGSHRNLRASPFEEVRDPLKLTREDGCSTHTTFNEEVFGLPIPTRLRVRATYDICSICLTLLPNSPGGVLGGVAAVAAAADGGCQLDGDALRVLTGDATIAPSVWAKLELLTGAGVALDVAVALTLDAFEHQGEPPASMPPDELRTRAAAHRSVPGWMLHERQSASCAARDELARGLHGQVAELRDRAARAPMRLARIERALCPQVRAVLGRFAAAGRPALFDLGPQVGVVTLVDVNVVAWLCSRFAGTNCPVLDITDQVGADTVAAVAASHDALELAVALAREGTGGSDVLDTALLLARDGSQR